MTDRERLRAEIASRLMAPIFYDVNGKSQQDGCIAWAIHGADTLLAALGQPERESDVSDELLSDLIGATTCPDTKHTCKYCAKAYEAAIKIERARSAAGKGE